MNRTDHARGHQQMAEMSHSSTARNQVRKGTRTTPWRRCRGQSVKGLKQDTSHTLPRIASEQKSARTVAAVHSPTVDDLPLSPELHQALLGQLGADSAELIANMARYRSTFTPFEDHCSWPQFVVSQLCFEAAKRRVRAESSEPVPGLIESVAIEQEYARLLGINDVHGEATPVMVALGRWNLLDNLDSGELCEQQGFELLLDMAVSAKLEPDTLFALLCFAHQIRQGESTLPQLTDEQSPIFHVNKRVETLAQGRALWAQLSQVFAQDGGLAHLVNKTRVKEHVWAFCSYFAYLKTQFLACESPVTDPVVQKTVATLLAMLRALGEEAELQERAKLDEYRANGQTFYSFADALAMYSGQFAASTKHFSGFETYTKYSALVSIFYSELGTHHCIGNIYLKRMFDTIHDIMTIASERTYNVQQNVSAKDITFLHGTSTDTLSGMNESAGLLLPSGYLVKHCVTPMAGELGVPMRISLNKTALSGANLATEEMCESYFKRFAAQKGGKRQEKLKSEIQVFLNFVDMLKGEQARTGRAFLFNDAYGSYGVITRAQNVAISFSRLKQIAPQQAQQLLPTLHDAYQRLNDALMNLRQSEEYKAAVLGEGDQTGYRDGYVKNMLLNLENCMATLGQALVSPIPKEPSADQESYSILLGSNTLSNRQVDSSTHERMLQRPALMGRDIQFVFCKPKDKAAVTAKVKGLNGIAGKIKVHDLAVLKRAVRCAKRHQPRMLAMVKEQLLAAKA